MGDRESRPVELELEQWQKLEVAAKSLGSSLEKCMDQCVTLWLKQQRKKTKEKSVLPWAPMDDYLPQSQPASPKTAKDPVSFATVNQRTGVVYDGLLMGVDR